MMRFIILLSHKAARRRSAMEDKQRSQRVLVSVLLTTNNANSTNVFAL